MPPATEKRRRRGRRALLALVAALVVLPLVGWAGLTWWWPGYRPSLQPSEQYAIDVSEHQGVVDWRAVARDGIRLASVKATEGATRRDRQFTANWAGARAAGLPVGAYHFFTFCRAGADQARNFLDTLAAVPQDGMLDPVVDVEDGGNCTDPPPRETVLAELHTFVTQVERATGRRVMVYALGPWAGLDAPGDGSPREVWVRSLLFRPGGDWSWWQVNNRTRVDGIRGPVDLNVVRSPGPS